VSSYRFALEHSAQQSRVGTSHLYSAVKAILEGKQDVAAALVEAQIQAHEILTEQAQAKVKATPQTFTVATPVPETDGGIEITFAAFSSNTAVYQELAKSFKDSHPDITVKIRQPDFSSGFGLEMMAASGDCFVWYTSVGEEMQKYVLNLTPLLETGSDVPLNDFYPQTLDAFQWRNNLWALPANINIEVMYYNKDLFDAADVAYPQAGWTLDEFLTKAKSLTREEGVEKQYGYLSIQGSTQELLIFLSLMGATWIDDQVDPARFHYTNPDLVEALRWYIDLSEIHRIAPRFEEEDPARPGTTAWQKRLTLMQANKGAMWISGVEVGPVSTIPEGMNIGIAPLPHNKDTLPSSLITGYYIAKETPHPKQCWDWITFLSNEKSIETAQGDLPSRRSVAESVDFRAEVGDEVADAYLYSIERTQDIGSLVQTWTSPGYHWLFEAYGQAIEDISVETALDQAQRKADIYLTCLEEGDGFANEEVQKSCAKKADPEFRWFGEEDE